ncbi:jg25655, partial [Pararge aegeria aegeria]
MLYLVLVDVDAYTTSSNRGVGWVELKSEGRSGSGSGGIRQRLHSGASLPAPASPLARRAPHVTHT